MWHKPVTMEWLERCVIMHTKIDNHEIMHNHPSSPPSKNSFITKYRQKSWKKAMVHNKGEHPNFTTHQGKKNGPHEYSASIEINMHEICYGSCYPYSTCWVIPMKLLSTPLQSTSQQRTKKNTGTAELHLSTCWLRGLPVIWIGLDLGLNLSRMLQN